MIAIFTKATVVAVGLVLGACSSSIKERAGTLSYQPVALSEDLAFRLSRSSRGADDHDRDRIDLCGRTRSSCIAVVEYETGWLPLVSISGQIVDIRIVNRGVTETNRSITIDGNKYEINYVLLPPPRSEAESSHYNLTLGVNDSPNYSLVLNR